MLKDFRPLEGTILYTSRHQIADNTDMLNYSHLMLRAWRDLKLSSILCIDGLPTLYLRQDKRKISAAYANKLHLEFWNQGIATVLILVDPRVVRVYSGLATPVAPDDDTDRPSCLIETLRTADLAIRWNQIATELATGQFYRAHPDKFDPEKAVDAYLLENLGNVRDFLTEGPHALPAKMAHAFLGRVLFACYLIDRRVVNLSDYDFADGTTKLINLLKLPNSPTFTDAKTRLYRLFEDLAVKFNGSMFDKDLIGEKRLIRKSHLDAVVHFLRGDPIRENQRTLGFWAFDFKWIPVETISAIYEDFLEKEDSQAKRKSGAYYTPRFLAELVIDIATENVHELSDKRFLDPACGSGIFLVLLFNRLAAV